MDLVHDQDLVLGQGGLPLDLAEEQPHRQEHDLGGRRACAFKADLVANLGWEGGECEVRRVHNRELGHQSSSLLHTGVRCKAMSVGQTRILWAWGGMTVLL